MAQRPRPRSDPALSICLCRLGIKTGSALVEHKISASPPELDICALMTTRASNCVLPAVSPRRGERGKAAFEIADQVVDVLKSDVQAHRRPAWRPFRSRADARAVEWSGQALESAPRRADAEQAELVHERVDRTL